MMASAKRKQDEKNLKILRELVSLPGNKECFDCRQRGPTYVNMTIGSFVCTSCSGMLRGLTPPHRVKSISMATFTQEEIDFIKERGNEYCRRIWLGLMNPNSPQNLDAKDEQKMKDLMSAKYEFKRYYLDPSMAGKETNSPKQQQTVTSTATTTTTMSTNNVDKRTGGSSSPAGQIGIPRVPVSGSTSMVLSTSSKLKNADLISTNSDFADFSKMRTSDPFVPATTVANQIEPILPQPSFANFDNNPIFDSTKNSSTAFDQISTNFANFNGPNAPSEDRYAALKDLDSLMKQTQLQDDTRTVSAWNTNNANGTHVWSGANNQTTNNVSNPFASTDLWKPSINSVNNNNTPFSSSSSSSIDNAFYNNPANPFKPMQFSTNNDPTWMGGTMSNGDVIPFGQTMTPISNKVWQPAVSPYHANPFMVGSGVTNSTRNSNNPFL